MNAQMNIPYNSIVFSLMRNAQNIHVYRVWTIIFSLFFNLIFLDENECLRGTNPCDSNATCEDTLGSYKCTCKPGYTGKGMTCKSMYIVILFLVTGRSRSTYVFQSVS